MYETLLARAPSEIVAEVKASHCDLLQMKVDALNSAEGTLRYVNCPACRNKGYVAYIDGREIKMRDCECVTRRRVIKNVIESGIFDIVKRYTFDTYEANSDWQKEAKEKAQYFAADKNRKWFAITGNPGSGKTHLCIAIAGALLAQGKNVRYFLWRDEAPKLKALVNERDEYERVMRDIKTADVLYIDDFLKGNVTAGDINLAFEIINARYNNTKLTTIISSERTIEDINDIDEAIGSRIYERTKGFYIKTPKENLRLQ